MTSRDVISAYKLFLNRIPESEEVVNARVGLSDFELLSHFLSSDEFIKNPKNEALILEVVSNLLRRLKNSQNQITAIKENPWIDHSYESYCTIFWKKNSIQE